MSLRLALAVVGVLLMLVVGALIVLDGGASDAGLICGAGTHREVVRSTDYDLPDECRPGAPVRSYR